MNQNSAGSKTLCRAFVLAMCWMSLGNASAAEFIGSLVSTKPAVVELGVPIQHALPLRIFATGPVF
jgi:hypothetical protein